MERNERRRQDEGRAARRAAPGLPWDQTHPEETPWATSTSSESGSRPTGTEDEPDARDPRQDTYDRLLDLLENHVVPRLDDLGRRITALEEDRSPR